MHLENTKPTPSSRNRSRRLLATCGVLSALWISAAQAVAPSDTVHIGSEPQRVFNVHAPEQVRLLQSDAWQDFSNGDGPGWMARFDELTGTPHRMWGPGIPLGALNTPTDAEAAVRSFVLRHSALLGVEAGQLQLRAATQTAASGTWYVDFDVLVDGAPVYRAGISARIKHNKLVMLGADTYPTTPVLGEVRMSQHDAIARGIAGGAAPLADHSERSARLVALPLQDDSGLHLRMAWETKSRTFEPPGKWVAFIDAATGEVLNVHNEVRFFEGTVWAEHDTRTVDGNLSESPMPFARIWNDTESAYANEFGEFSISDADSYGADFISQYVRVNNEGGDNASLTLTADTPNLMWNGNNASMAEIDTYIGLNVVRDYWGQYASLDWISGSNRGYVNIEDSCNAYYDGNVNFFTAGNGCNNTGRIADVIYHEWGHGFHDHSLVSGFPDGAMGEGIGDVVAMMITQDHIMAPYFMTNGSGIRDSEPDRVYPVDWTGQVHADGLIFAGAIWDLLQILTDKYGNEVATQMTSQLVADGIKGGPTVETSYDELFFADDDDGDLSNGTPNECDLIDAFRPHGLGPLGTGSALAGWSPQPGYPANQPTEIDVQLVSPAPNCFLYEPESAMVHYRVNGGDWEQEVLDTELDTVLGAIPGQQLGDLVEYWVRIVDVSGQILKAPNGGQIHPYTYYVGDVVEVACSDFEDGDGGYSHSLLEGEEGEGADDWQWGTPMGRGGDPDMAHSGTKVWGNDLGEGEYNGEYQNDKRNQLQTPVYETGHYQGAFLNYWRWLNVEDGVFDQASLWADGELLWTNWGTTQQNGIEHTRDDQWMPHSVDLRGMGDDGSVQIAWEITSDQGLTMGGWTIDDVCLFAPATPDNRLGISDFEASNGLDGGVTLSWTQPKHAPLQRVTVVRNAVAMPQGPTDGTVVYDNGSPELGTEVAVTDDGVANGKTYYYAAYASDGSDWLSFTVQGWNADDGDAIMPVDPNSEEKVGGCGCSSTGSSAPWLLLLGVGLLARRRD